MRQNLFGFTSASRKYWPLWSTWVVLYIHMVGVLVFVIVIHFHNGLFVTHSNLEMSYFYFICIQATEFTVFINLMCKKIL